MQTFTTAQQEMFNALASGKIFLPNRDLFIEHFGSELTALTDSMFQAAWHTFVINEGGINLFHWAKKFGKENIKQFNDILEQLSQSGWLICDSNKMTRFATATLSKDKLEFYLGSDLLLQVRKARKLKAYLPKVDLTLDGSQTGLVKSNGNVSESGLQRPGFAKSSRTQYYYDTAALIRHYPAVIRNTNKGMAKVREKWTTMTSSITDYDSLSTEVINHIIAECPMMDLGQSWLDSRGRAIKGALSKVANPIGYKDFRALLTIPYDKRDIATEAGVTAINLFIAELNGWKANTGNGTTVEDKTSYGNQCYLDRTLPEMSDKDLYEIVWLERLYEDLDAYYLVQEINTIATQLGQPATEVHKWSVPIELDASASMLSYMGCLLGDQRLLQATNTVVTDGTLRDPWGMTDLDRNKFKSPVMKITYGSSKSITQLWVDDKIEYTLDDVAIINAELKSGGIGVANDFKEFIIRNVKPTATMNLDIFGQQFTVECNRHRKVADTVIQFDLYNTGTSSVERINHMHTHLTPDLDGFKRWFVTGLIHNLDSYVADNVMNIVMDQFGWGIDIHDAFIVSPEAANLVRTEYSQQMEAIYTNRGTILNNYFKSINIGAEAVEEWNRVMSKVDKIETFVANPMALK